MPYKAQMPFDAMKFEPRARYRFANVTKGFLSFVVLLLLACSLQRVGAGHDDVEGLQAQAELETIGYGDLWSSGISRNIVEGGHVLVVLRRTGDLCARLSADSIEPKLYVFVGTELVAPSSEGGLTGEHFDLLVPYNETTCALSPYLLVEWRAWSDETVTLSDDTGAVTVDVVVSPQKDRVRPTLYVGATASYIMHGHCDPDCPREVPLIAAYSDMLADHGVQPIQNWIRFPGIEDGRLDLDAWGEASFRQRVMRYAADGKVGFPRASWYPDPVAYLKALEQTILEEALVGMAWVYAADEPGDIDVLAGTLRLYREHAPSVLIMVTTNLDPRLEGLVDIYAPVLNRLGRGAWPGADAYAGHGLWPYVSCMGSCGPNRAAVANPVREPGPDTMLPDMLMDRPAERLFDYFQELAEIGADGGLYYEAVEGHRLLAHGIDPITDPWNFGGNGDGVLVYPGRAGSFGLVEDQPLPSWRLKLMRYATEMIW